MTSACACSSSSAASTSAGTPTASGSRRPGIEIHRYGAHLFHTSNARVWEYANQYTAFTGYQHRVFSVYKGRVYPLPINLGTICEYFGAVMSPDEARALVAEQAAEVARRRTRPTSSRRPCR